MKRAFRFIKREGSAAADKESLERTIGLWYDSIGRGEWMLSLDKVSNPRSVSQNNLMWLWFTAIAREWSDACDRGFTPQIVHDAYCQMFLPVTLPDGRTVGGSTSGLTVEQMTEFLNKVQADASSVYGITLPTPDDLRFEEWKQQYK